MNRKDALKVMANGDVVKSVQYGNLWRLYEGSLESSAWGKHFHIAARPMEDCEYKIDNRSLNNDC